MSRPRRLEKQVYFIKLWLLPGRDGDVIRYLENAPAGQRVAAVLRAMRGGLANQPQPKEKPRKWRACSTTWASCGPDHSPIISNQE